MPAAGRTGHRPGPARCRHDPPPARARPGRGSRPTPTTTPQPPADREVAAAVDVVRLGVGLRRLRPARPRRRPSWPSGGSAPPASTSWWSASSSRARAPWSTPWSGRPSARWTTTSPRPCRPTCGTASSPRPACWSRRRAAAPARPSRSADVRRYVVEGADRRAGTSAADGARVTGVEVRLPRKMLAGGLVLVDTPGVGGLGSPHAAASLAAISMADAVLFVTDAAQELTRSEVDFLRRARELCAGRRLRHHQDRLLPGVAPDPRAQRAAPRRALGAGCR